MVLQNTVDNLKARPRHERRAIARVASVFVVGLLFIGWIIVFFNDIRTTGIQIEPIGIPVGEALNSPQITEARRQMQNSFGGVQDTLRTMQIYDTSAGGDVQTGASSQRAR